MLRVKISRWLNHRLFAGNPKLMISSRVYIEDRVILTALIDLLFWYVRGEVEHCRNSMYYDLQGEDYV